MPAAKARAGQTFGWGQPPRTRPDQGLFAQATWPLPRPPFQYFLLPWRTEAGIGVPGKENNLGKGSPLHRVPRIHISLGRKTPPGAWGGTEKHGVLG